jgi:signal transduction histidine kinase
VGTEIELTTRGPGDVFGELALLEGGPRSASVGTIEPSDFLVIDQPTFLGLLAGPESPAAAVILSTLSRMIRERTDGLWQQELARIELGAQMEIERHRALSQMVAGVAHELNTPLGIANTAADLIENRLRDGRLRDLASADGKAEQTMDDIAEASALVRRNLERANVLVQNFKRVSAEQLAERADAVDLPALTQDVVDLYSIEARRARIAVTIDDRLPKTGRRWLGYPGYYTQVLLNLLSNVERYAYPAGVGGPVEIVLERREHEGQSDFAVAVIDHGRGIEPEHLGQVFEPFFTTGRIQGGTGLGMAIVRNLVSSALGGSVRLESAPGEGLAVRIAFPETAPPSPAARVTGQPSRLSSRGPTMS